MGRTLRILAMAVAMVAASLVAVAPAPAYAANTIVEIVNAQSQLRADVMWASTSQYQGVFLWPDNASLSQEFEILDSGGGFFRLAARHSGQCLMLDWRSGYYTDGTPVIQYPYCSAGYAPAEWYTAYITPPQDPCYCFPTQYMVIKNRATGRCLDAASSTGQPGVQAVLQQWSCITVGTEWNRWNQVWRFNQLNNLPNPH